MEQQLRLQRRASGADASLLPRPVRRPAAARHRHPLRHTHRRAHRARRRRLPLRRLIDYGEAPGPSENGPIGLWAELAPARTVITDGGLRRDAWCWGAGDEEA